MARRKIRLFYSYAHRDEALREQLEHHLSALRQEGLIEDWHDRNISAGKEWEKEISTYLEEADIILLLISADFMASRYCYSIEGKRALERHEAGEARVIPVLLRATHWQITPLAKLQALPRDARPITSWPNQDEAFLAVAQGIQTVIDELQASQQDATTTVENEKTHEEAKATEDAHPHVSHERPWNVPFRRNMFFTGREQVLSLLRERLVGERTAALTQPLAISGLGGVGKTQIAVEYAYRHRDEYSAILWASAATLESLQGDFVKIAHLLNLPEKDAREQAVIIEAVRRWLAHERDWLLILDNADDTLPQIRSFLPDTGETNGHILITTRDPAAGNLAEPLEVTQMEREEGMQLLLRRARKLAQATDEDYTQAAAIVDLLGGLPLALDQAGAYIEENRCSLADYQALYRQRRKELLGWLGRFPSDYPRVVATTWDLSFQQVEADSPAAAELLRFCAFLDPDAIPEELLSEGAPELGPILSPIAADPFKLNQAINHLLRYSLLKRDPATKTLTIHRLVQAVLLDRMNQKTRRRWAERTIRALSRTFPYDSDDYRNWPLCQRLLPHVQVCVGLVDQYTLSFREAKHLLHQTGVYLRERALYEQAETFLKQALLMGKKVDGAEDSNTAATLHELGKLSYVRGHYEQAKKLFQRALHIYEKTKGPEHPFTATTLHELAGLYLAQSQYEQAEELFQRALRIYEKTKGPEHPSTGSTLHELARLYQNKGQYEQAEELYRRALNISEKTVGPEHPDTAITLGMMGVLYEERSEYERAEDYYRQALVVLERVLGDEHPTTIAVARDYVDCLRKMGRAEEAAKLKGRIKKE